MAMGECGRLAVVGGSEMVVCFFWIFLFFFVFC